MLPVPRVGDTIYVDDTDVVQQTYIRGGLATVSEVSVHDGRRGVHVGGVAGGEWAWEDYLATMQADLAACYGSIRAGKYIVRPEDAREAERDTAPNRGGES